MTPTPPQSNFYRRRFQDIRDGGYLYDSQQHEHAIQDPSLLSPPIVDEGSDEEQDDVGDEEREGADGESNADEECADADDEEGGIEEGVPFSSASENHIP